MGDASANSFRTLSYSGRLISETGRPLTGPINLQISFYDRASGGTALGNSPYLFQGVKLSDGVFQIVLNLPQDEAQSIFQDGATPIWVEVKDSQRNRPYPRQQFAVVPYAMKVPVDGVSINYNAQGELQTQTIQQNQVSGLNLALADKADKAELAAKADLSALGSKANTSDLASKADVAHSHALSGDVSGNLSNASVVRIQGISVLPPDPITDAGKYLVFDGTRWLLNSISGSSGGTVTDVTASSPLNVTNGSTTPNLTIDPASSTQSGYLSSTDWNIFNSKQEAITPAIAIDAASYTAAAQNAFVAKPYGGYAGNTGELRFSELSANGNQFVGFKAPDSISSSAIWTLPSADGSSGYILSTNGNGVLSWSPPPADSVAMTDASALTTGTLADGRLSTNVSLFGSAIDTTEITDGAVTTAKINDASITAAKLADGTITAAKLSTMGCNSDQVLKFNGTSWTCAASSGTATTDASDLTSGTLADARLSANVSLLGSAIDTAEITNEAVTTAKIAAGSVTTAIIADGSITGAKLNAMGCSNNQILKFNGTSWVCSADNDTVTSNATNLTSGTLADARLSTNVSLLGNSIETTEIADEAVTAAKIADGSVTAAKLNAMGCATNQILKFNGTKWLCTTDNNTVTTDASTLTSGTLADARLSASVSLLGGSIETAEITNSAVTAAKIADGAITAAKLNTMGCTNSHILKFNGTSWICSADSDTLTTNASDLTSGALDDARLSSNVSLFGSAIDTAEISDNAVTSDKLAGSIPDSKLATISTAGKVSGNAITSGTISGTTTLNLAANSLVVGSTQLVLSGGRVGVGKSPADTTLEVNGGVKISNDSNACNTSKEGTMRYNSGSKAIQFCNGSSWSNISGVKSCRLCGRARKDTNGTWGNWHCTSNSSGGVESSTVQFADDSTYLAIDIIEINILCD